MTQLDMARRWYPYWTKAQAAHARAKRFELKIRITGRHLNGSTYKTTSIHMGGKPGRGYGKHLAEWCRREDKIRLAFHRAGFTELGNWQICDLMEAVRTGNVVAAPTPPGMP